MKNVFGPEEGEHLSLGAPCAGDIFVKVSSGGTGALNFVLQTMASGGLLPQFRLSGCDLVFFIYKGQARVRLGEKALTVVPGAVLVVPHHTWCEIRNTGTGLLQLVWAASTPVFVDFFRAYAQAVQAGDNADFKAIGQRYGLEFGEPEAKPAASAKPHRKHERWKRHRQPAKKTPSPPQAPAAAAAAPMPVSAQPPVSQQSPATMPKHPPASQDLSRRQKTRSPARPPPKQQAQGKRPPRRHLGRAKMVYMGGRWVRITGEGPVIAQGETT